MADDQRLPAVAAAAVRASGSDASTAAVVPAGGAVVRVSEVETGRPPRKRSRQVHERQVLANFFSDEDQPDGGAPPKELINGMSTRDLYEDVYSSYKVDTSFSSLSKGTKSRMLAEIAAVAPKVAGRVVQASAADPTAITVPRTHTHETVLVPPAAAAAADRTASVKEAHLAQLCGLHAYDALEDYARSLEFGGVPRKTTLGKLVRVDLRACVPHSMHRASPDLAYLIFELEERQVFFAAVGVRWCSAAAAPESAAGAADEPAARLEPYEPWTAAMLGDLGPAAIEVVAHFYFCCPCV